MSNDEKITIEVSDETRALFLGTSVGNNIATAIDEAGKGTYVERHASYWMQVGFALAKQFGEASAEVQEAFAIGAAGSQVKPPALVLVIDDINGAAFGNGLDDDDEETFDEEQCRSELARIMRKQAEAVTHGMDTMTPMDINGAKVGDMDVNLYI